MNATPAELHVRSRSVDVRLCRYGPQTEQDVLLVPGLGASPHAFVARPERSLASELRDAGFTPWTVDFQVSWCGYDQRADALLHGLELAVSALDRRTPGHHSRVHAVGHSLGGMLLLALAASGQHVSRIVTLGAAVDLRPGRSHLSRLLALMPAGLPQTPRMLRRGGVPLRGLARVGAPLFGRRVRLSVEQDQFHPGTTEGRVIRALIRDGVRDLPLPLLLDLVALFTERGLHVGRCARPLRNAVRTITVPTLLVGAVQDRQCPIAAVRDTACRIPGARLLEVGASPARGRGYGHVDLMTGRDAPRDVFRPVVAFLQTD